MEELAGLIPIIIIAVVSAISKSSNKKQQAQKHPYGGSAKPVSWPDASPASTSRPASMSSMLPPREEGPRQPVQTTVHTHYAPACDTHDAPGSLGVGSTEGKDPCHEDQLTDALPAQREMTEKPGLTLDWSGDAMVRAFVMQEVLTRPCDRRKH